MSNKSQGKSICNVVNLKYVYPTFYWTAFNTEEIYCENLTTHLCTRYYNFQDLLVFHLTADKSRACLPDIRPEKHVWLFLQRYFILFYLYHRVLELIWCHAIVDTVVYCRQKVAKCWPWVCPTSNIFIIINWYSGHA